MRIEPKAAPAIAILFCWAMSTAVTHAYDATPLSQAIEKHEIIVLAKVVDRAGGKATLMPEKVIKGRLAERQIVLPETWSAESRTWNPVTLLDRKRFLLMLHRSEEGELIYSTDPLAESLMEISYVDEMRVRLVEITFALMTAESADARKRILDDVWTNESDATRERMLFMLLELGRDPATIDYLNRCMSAGAERSGLMEMAAVIIGKFQYNDCAATCLKALEKDDWACIYPAKALADLKVREAYEPIIKLIRSPIAQNRTYFVESLCKLEDPRSIPFLIETAKRNLEGIDPKFGTYRSFDVRENEFAVAALGTLGAKQAEQALIQISRQSTHKKLRELASASLMQIRASK